MKILQLIFNLASAGAQKFTIDLSNQLAETNEVYLCVIQTDRDKELAFFKDQLNQNVNYINLDCAKGFNYKMFFTIFKVLKRVEPNVVHAHLNTKIYLFIPSLFYKNRIKFIHTIHNLAHKDVGFFWQKRINKFFYKKNIINAVAISEECKSSFLELYKNPNVSLVENGVTTPSKTNKFFSVQKEINSMKNIPSDKVFIHVARFSEQKNQKLLVNVFNRIIKENHGIILVVIGNGFDTKEAKQLMEISNPGINYLGKRNNIQDYLLNSDSFILSSLWEGLPISLLEAMSCGVIPVCTPAGGIPDVIKDETIGYISKDFTEQALYEAVIRCLDNMETFDRFFLKEYFEKNYSINKCADKYENIYHS